MTLPCEILLVTSHGWIVTDRRFLARFPQNLLKTRYMYANARDTF